MLLLLWAAYAADTPPSDRVVSRVVSPASGGGLALTPPEPAEVAEVPAAAGPSRAAFKGFAAWAVKPHANGAPGYLSKSDVADRDPDAPPPKRTVDHKAKRDRGNAIGNPKHPKGKAKRGRPPNKAVGTFTCLMLVQQRWRLEPWG